MSNDIRNTDELSTLELLIDTTTSILADLLLFYIIIGSVYNIIDGVIGLYGQIPLLMLLLYPVIGIIVCVIVVIGIRVQRVE